MPNIATTLLEMTLFKGDKWVDCDYNTWVDCDYNTWLETDIIVRASHMGYAGAQYWDQFVISLSSPQFRIEQLSGGYCKLSFGDVTLTLDTFIQAQVWPPPDSAEVLISYVDDAHVRHDLFVGSMHRTKLSRDGIVYQLYEHTYDQLLLDEAIDYEGNTVPLPRAFGAVEYQIPVRMPDAGGGNQVYHHGYLAGTLHTNWHVFDDGVDICSNVENETASTFELNTLPVGEVTVSGSGAATTLIEIFNWAGARLGLDRDNTLATAFTAAHWASSQEVLTAWLDKLAAYACHLFYISGTTIYLVAMDADNGADIELTESEYFPSSVTYAAPISLVRAKWTNRQAVEESIGKYVKDLPQEVVVSGLHPFGPEQSVEVYQTTIPAVTASVENIHDYMTSPRWETSIPLVDIFPLPGQRITAADDSMGQRITVDIHIRDIEYDLEGCKIKLAGEGVIS